MGSATFTGGAGTLPGFLGRRFWLAAFALATVCALVSVRAGRSAGFIDDDLANLAYGKQFGFGTETFLGLPEARDHLLPGTAALNKVLSLLGPHWWVAQVITAVLVLTAVVLTAAFLRQLTGSPRLALFVCFLVGTSLVIGRIALWWTAASLSLPMLCMAFVTLILSVLWFESRSRVFLVLAVIAQLLACSFSDRAVLLPALVWVVLAVRTPNGPGSLASQLRARTRRMLPLLVPLAAIVVAQVVLTLILAKANTSGGISYAASASAVTWAEVIANWWARGVAGVLSNTFPPPSLLTEGSLDPGKLSLWNGTTLAATSVGAAVLAALGFITLRSSRAALAWAALAALVTLSGVQIAAGRLESLGAAGIAMIPRYQELTLLFLAVLLPLAWSLPGRRRVGASPVLVTVVAFALATFWLIQLRSGVRAALDGPIVAASYAHNLDRSLRAAAARDDSYTVLDDRVPEAIMRRIPQTAWASWLSSATRVLAAGAEQPAFDRLSGRAYRVLIDGTARPVSLGATLRLPSADLGCVSTTPDSAWLGAGTKRIDIRPPDNSVGSSEPLVLTVALARSGPVGEIGIVPASAQVPYRVLQLAQHPHGFRLLVPGESVAISIDLWGGARTCLRQVSLSRLQAP